MLHLIAAGTYGTVSVEWYVDPTRTTAVRGTDYIADGALLTFADGESIKGTHSLT